MCEIDPNLLYEPIGTARHIAGSHMVVTCVDGVYTESRDQDFLQFAKKYFCDLQQVDCFEQILKTDKVVQCSVYHPEAKKHVLPALSAFKECIEIYLSENMWVDIHRLGVDKGTGLQELQQRYGITAGESMAFGDYLNDIGLMKACTHTFAMKNSHPALAAMCKYQIGSNNENAVVGAIKKWFHIG